MLFLGEGEGSLCKTAVGRPRRDMMGQVWGLLTGFDRRGRDPAKVIGQGKMGEPKERIGLILPAQACKAQAGH